MLLLATAHFAGLASALLCYNCGNIAVNCTYSNSTLAFECTVPMETLVLTNNQTCGTIETLDSADSVCGILLFTNFGFPQPAAVDTHLAYIGLLAGDSRLAFPTCDTTFSNRREFLSQKHIMHCLCNEDFCNSQFRVFIGESDSSTSSSPPSPSPTKEPSPPTLPPKGLTRNEMAAIIIGVIIVAMFITAVVMVVVIAYLFVHGKRGKTEQVVSSECSNSCSTETVLCPPASAQEDCTIKEDQNADHESNGIISVLVEHGQFGTVWKVAKRENGSLVTKVFSSKEKPNLLVK